MVEKKISFVLLSSPIVLKGNTPAALIRGKFIPCEISDQQPAIWVVLSYLWSTHTMMLITCLCCIFFCLLLCLKWSNFMRMLLNTGCTWGGLGLWATCESIGSQQQSYSRNISQILLYETIECNVPSNSSFTMLLYSQFILNFFVILARTRYNVFEIGGVIYLYFYHNCMKRMFLQVFKFLYFQKLLINANDISDEGISWESLSSLKYLTVLSLSQNQ